MHMHFSLHAVVPAPNTIFKNIKKVPPRSFFSYCKDNKIVTKQYWHLKSVEDNNYIINEKEALDLTKRIIG